MFNKEKDYIFAKVYRQIQLPVQYLTSTTMGYRFEFYIWIYPTSGPKNIHEISNTHRTFSSGDHETRTFKSTDNEIDNDDNHFGESGSGQP